MARFKEEILTFKPAEEERLSAYSQATEMIYSNQQSTEADLLVMQCASLTQYFIFHLIHLSRLKNYIRLIPNHSTLSNFSQFHGKGYLNTQRTLSGFLGSCPKEMCHFFVMSFESH